VRARIAVLVAALAGIAAAFAASKADATPVVASLWFAVAALACYAGLTIFGVIRSNDADASPTGAAVVSVLDRMLGALGAFLKYLAIALKFLTTASCLLISVVLWVSVIAIIGLLVAGLLFPDWQYAPTFSERLLAAGALLVTLVVALVVARWFVKVPPKKDTIAGGGGAREKPGWCPRCNARFRQHGNELACPSCGLTLPVAGAGTD
jgi:hypothetical protein